MGRSHRGTGKPGSRESTSVGPRGLVAFPSAIEDLLPENVEPQQTEVAPHERPTFDDFMASHRRRGSFEVVAVAPYVGHNIGQGISVSSTPQTFQVRDLFALEKSYLVDLILDDPRVSVRLVD